MGTARYVDNFEDYLDSRDIRARITELREWRDSGEATETELESLASLEALADQAAGHPDWEYGVTLIRDSYFEDYARDLAEDIGAIGRDMPWPATHIDWGAAADALKVDYMAVEFDGVTYWMR